MKSEEFIPWVVQPGLWVAVLLMATLASYVALDLARRIPAQAGRSGFGWLAGSALALGTGLWSIHFVGLAGDVLPFGIGYGGGVTAAAWAVAVLACGLALHVGVVRGAGVARLLAAGSLLGSGVLVTLGLCFVGMRISPSLAWHPAWAAGAAFCAALGSALALALTLRLKARFGRVPRQLAAALLLGSALSVSHVMSTLAARVPFDAVSLNHFSTASNGTLALLASVGTVALLSLLLLLSIIEARMHKALHRAIGRIDEVARTDTLTSLPNRMSFDQQLEAAAAQADRRGLPMALLFVALDGFKPVNDSFGRRVGDLALQEMAQRLQALARPGDKVARVGGDEFVLLMVRDADKDGAAKMAQRLLATLAEACELEGRQAVLSCSIGVVLYPRHGGHTTAMLHAEAAARTVKRSGGATYAFFEQHMLTGVGEQLDLLRDLRTALAKQQLELYYQPKIHAPSGEITGAEALMRWHHPLRGMVSPAVFIPLAERYGLIASLGNWVIDEACRQARVWRDDGLRMRVAINLSVHQLRHPDLPDRIADALARHQINPMLLTCEITESVAMEDPAATMKIFERLAGVGVHISIDDFGTGYSSLSYLRKLPARELKIDRSFVLDLETSADARAVVDAVVKLAQALGLKVVAEGVETEAQSQILRSLGCDELQGYLFAKPMSAKALALWAMDDEGPSALAFRPSLFEETAPMEMA
ncbi:MAG: EAL domain-containing protein [Burkholderiaceae bacterium]